MIKCDKKHKSHGGEIGYYSHASVETGVQMRFTMFTPPLEKVTGSYVIFLSGLTCSEDNFTVKAGAYQMAAELGLHVLSPDTSPRGDDVPDVSEYDLGQGAGFYLDATEEPWSKNFRMESYLIKELLPDAEKFFYLDAKRKSIMGHSMGGHGALSLYFKYPNKFKSCSAFAPIVAPSQVPWGQKAFSAYLGEDQENWTLHDATALALQSEFAKTNNAILIDQGLGDNFLAEQLRPELFEDACRAVGQMLTLRLHEGYDHSYFFIQSFMSDHLKWHDGFLKID